jgi:hypothetical protein
VPGGDSNTVIDAEGYVAPQGAPMNLATQVMVQGDYLQAIGVPLLAGRTLTPADSADTQPVAIVNQKLAAPCWVRQPQIHLAHYRQSLVERKISTDMSACGKLSSLPVTRNSIKTS